MSAAPGMDSVSAAPRMDSVSAPPGQDSVSAAPGLDEPIKRQDYHPHSAVSMIKRDPALQCIVMDPPVRA